VRGVNLPRFALLLVAGTLLSWPLWLAAAPAYERFLTRATNAIVPLVSTGRVQHQVTLAERQFTVHLRGERPSTGVQADARSVHFNWLLLIPLLVATRALGRGGPGWAGGTLAIAALVALHVAFLAAFAEYRILRYEHAHPQLQEALRFFCHFYYAVGRIGLAVLLWMPLALRALRPAAPSSRGRAGAPSAGAA
jgi:hypothetical protein